MEINWKQEAARLTEKVYAARGSNQANEVQALILVALQDAYDAGYGRGVSDEVRIKDPNNA